MNLDQPSDVTLIGWMQSTLIENTLLTENSRGRYFTEQRLVRDLDGPRSKRSWHRISRGGGGTGCMNKLWAPLRSPCTSARHRQTSTDSTHEGEKTGTRLRKSELFDVRFSALFWTVMEMQTQTWTIGEFRFTVDTDGPASGPPVLLLHGFPQTRHMWR